MAKPQRKHDGPKRYAIYLRCSSDEQANKEFSTIDAQRMATEQYVRDQGGVVIDEYVDEGRSGGNVERPGFEKMCDEATLGRFDAVVVNFFNRLGRGDALAVAEHLLKTCHVTVESVKEKNEPGVKGYIEKFVNRFVDGMAIEKAREQTIDKMEKMAAMGLVCGGQDRFGYKKVSVDSEKGRLPGEREAPKILIPHPDEAEIVGRAFAHFVQSRSLSQVCDYMNETTTQNWNTDRVKYMLRNVVYLGVLVHGDWRNETAFEPIVERSVWQQANDILAVRSTIRPARNTEYAFYLRGRIFCAHCHCLCTPYPAKSGTVLYYACMDGMKKRTQCPVMRVNAVALHQTILTEIKRAAEHHTVMHRLIAGSGGWKTVGEDLKDKKSQLTKRRQANETALRNLTNAIVDAGHSRALLERLTKVEAERGEIEQALQQAEREIQQATVKRPTAEQVQGVWQQFMEAWPNMTEVEREKMMSGLVQRVKVKEKNLVRLELLPILDVRGSKYVTSTKWERGSDSN